VILRGERMPGAEDGPARSCRRGHRGTVTAPATCLRVRGSRAAAVPRRRAPARKARQAAAPESKSSPRSPLELVALPCASHAFSPMTSRLLPPIRPLGPDRGVPEARP